MSSTDDASSRLSDALEEILSGTPTLPPRDGERRPTSDAPQPAVEAVEQATVEVPVAEPTDPARAHVDTREETPTVEQPVAEPTDPARAHVDTPEASPTVEQPVAEPTDPARAHVDTPEASPDVEFYELPEIVPATSPLPLPESPTAPPARPAPAATPRAPSQASPTPAGSTASTAPTSGWGDHMASTAEAPPAQLRAPGRRPRVRRVTRVVRHIDPWSTFKVALVFCAVAYVVLLTAGVLLWRVADETGTLDNVERWFTQFGWETFELKGGEIFHNAWIIGLFGVVAMTGGLVLLATLFNLVSDIVGGIRVTVLEEEVVERTVSSTRRYVVRRGPTDAGPSAVPAQDWDVDAEDPAESAVPEAADWSVDDDGDDERSDGTTATDG